MTAKIIRFADYQRRNAAPSQAPLPSDLLNQAAKQTGDLVETSVRLWASVWMPWLK